MDREAPRPRRILVALGGNLGEVARSFRAALEAMPACGLVPTCTSRLYVTEAALWPGAAPQPPYLNAVVAARTALSPAEVLAALQRLERAAGPRVAARWGPRRLDLDYLADEHFVQSSPSLILPHPRAHGRAFVLWPAADVAPDWPLGGEEVSVRRLLRHSFADRNGVSQGQLSWWTDPRPQDVS